MTFLITAGPTREYLDPVRFFSNASSGKMGYALAAAARRRGHRVILVSGPVNLAAPGGVRVVNVTSAREMFEAVKKEQSKADIFIGAAAVSDWRPALLRRGKIKKTSAPVTVAMCPNPDIVRYLGSIKGKRVLVGFALESHRLPERAKDKLVQKNMDLIVANGPENIGGDKARIMLISRGCRIKPLPPASKTLLAQRILDEAISLRNDGATDKTLLRRRGLA